MGTSVSRWEGRGERRSIDRRGGEVLPLNASRLLPSPESPRSQVAALNGLVIAECGAYDPYAQRYAIALPDGRCVAVAVARVSAEAAASAMSDACAVCGAWGAARCSACLEAAYCGPVCQRKGWPGHRAACKAAKSTGLLVFASPAGPLRPYEVFTRSTSGPVVPPLALPPGVEETLAKALEMVTAAIYEGEKLDMDAIVSAASGGGATSFSMRAPLPQGTIKRGLEFDVELHRSLGPGVPLSGLFKVQPEATGVGPVLRAILVDRRVAVAAGGIWCVRPPTPSRASAARARFASLSTRQRQARLGASRRVQESRLRVCSSSCCSAAAGRAPCTSRSSSVRASAAAQQQRVVQGPPRTCHQPFTSGAAGLVADAVTCRQTDP